MSSVICTVFNETFDQDVNEMVLKAICRYCSSARDCLLILCVIYKVQHDTYGRASVFNFAHHCEPSVLVSDIACKA